MHPSNSPVIYLQCANTGSVHTALWDVLWRLGKDDVLLHPRLVCEVSA